MVKFAKPGASDDYNVMAAKARGGPQGRRRRILRRGRAGVRRLRLRRQHLRAAGGLRGRPHRHPRVQRQQQLLDRLDRAVARRARRSRAEAECVLVVGFEQMEKGALGRSGTTAPTPLDQHAGVMNDVQGFNQAPPPRRCSAAPAASTAGSTARSARPSPRSPRRPASTPPTTPTRLFARRSRVEEILASPEVFDPLTRYQCCPPTCGAAAAVVCSEEFAKKHGISNPVYIAAQAMTTDYGRASRTA
jgi:sterol carrier protein 2